MKRRYKIKITGMVQGVGFRPFVFRIAHRYGLAGFVCNDSNGVTIEIEGHSNRLEQFMETIEGQAPPLSRIVQISKEILEPLGYEQFNINKSESRNGRTTLISPDIAVCQDCLSELFDPQDRRYRYPFINCTNCGPRYTITRDIPYDRCNTSMADFTMCPDCQKEYDDPADRRFHAQPNACPVCGPQIMLVNREGRRITVYDPVAETAQLIKQGNIVAIKGLGGFHLTADALNDDSVKRLRQRKQREEKPLAIMVPDIETAREFVEVSEIDKDLLNSPEHPILLLHKKLQGNIATSVAPNNSFLGVMLPYTPLHHVLMKEGFKALVMTSGNLTDEPIAIANHEALQRLGYIADYFLIHDRDILLRSDDSVICIDDMQPLPIRRSRGYVPVPVFLTHNVPPLLACGGELKNTICLTKGQNAFLSQHIGDLENIETLNFFEECILHLERILEINPEIIAYDLHPRYLSTQWAQNQGDVELVGVQHHHAHIAACLAENSKSGPVIGLAMDGTGLGSDGHIWGGEVLIADLDCCERAAHFEYIPLPGGEKAIKEPWRVALSYLYHVMGNDLWHLTIPFIQKLNKQQSQIIVDALAKRINTPLTSSLGRLFDGVAALLDIKSRVAFEGQAAMELEMAMYDSDGNRNVAADSSVYHFGFENEGDVIKILFNDLFKGLVEDILTGLSKSEISAKFHRSIINVLSTVCDLVRARTQISTVALSGGCFQNRYFSTWLPRVLNQKGFKVLTHTIVPPNDGGISLGQAVVAAARSKYS